MMHVPAVERPPRGEYIPYGPIYRSFLSYQQKRSQAYFISLVRNKYHQHIKPGNWKVYQALLYIFRICKASASIQSNTRARIMPSDLFRIPNRILWFEGCPVSLDVLWEVRFQQMVSKFLLFLCVPAVPTTTQGLRFSTNKLRVALSFWISFFYYLLFQD